MERKMLNIILRHRLRNEDIRRQTHIKDAAETAGKLKKKWAGHVMRVNENRWTCILTTWDSRIGKRNAGRQKTSLLHGRSQDGTHCSKKETLAHVLGYCPRGELLHNTRHNRIRSKIAAALSEPAVTAPPYPDILEEYVLPQTTHKQPSMVFQQHGTPPHWRIIHYGSRSTITLDMLLRAWIKTETEVLDPGTVTTTGRDGCPYL
ncbi:hypothetical protein ANN_04394 [Periplaneta americana]|uniref:Uncharacterized protein n=1 Tax=Periplaneta americana TaxID=6978 RepID=A0ABQ8T9Y6_PERAM|nr:hypothetical protein ANN_04394 [Periplaneta americana]